jgi:D-alanine-D-alanine ligase
VQNNKVFIKASRQGSTIGAYRFDPKEHTQAVEEFRRLCKEAFKYDSRILVEDWVEGRELTVTLFKGKALPIIEIKPKSEFYDFQHKYTKGFTEYLCPAPIDPQTTLAIQKAAERAYVVLENKDFCRMDVMLDKSLNFFILEMNTLPGMTETSLVPKAAAATGLGYDDFLEELVVYSYNRQRTS